MTFLCVKAVLVFPQVAEAPDAEAAAPRGASETIKHGFIGAAEVLLSNAVVLAFNVFGPVKHSWAVPTAEAIRGNFTLPWQWENTDAFKDNQIGHPYHGSTFFSAGRVNGFNFYGSAFFSAFGSFTWEAFGESNHASMNDLITSTIASLSLGEIFYRLYLEACAAGVPVPVTFLINPVAGFHRLVTQWEPSGYGGNMYELRFQFGAGYARIDSSITGSGKNLFFFKGFFPDLTFSIVYGNPFEQDSRVPFEHFEFAGSLGTNARGYLTSRVITDGYLFSFSPVFTGKNRMSTGLSLHMDYMSTGPVDNNSIFDHSSNALDWTIKYQRIISGNASLEAKFHAGATFLGASEYYSGTVNGSYGNLRNYGSGINSKLYFNLRHKKLGELKTDLFCYMLWSLPGTSALSKGRVFWLFNDVTYSFPVSKHFSVGISNFFALELGAFGNFPETRKYCNETRLFAAWNL